MTDEFQISEREREILQLVATGATNQQIAQQLNISINTVKVHLRNIFGKIGVVSRTEATLYAVRTGLVSVERGGAATVVADEPEEELETASLLAAPIAAAPAAPPPVPLSPGERGEPALVPPPPAPARSPLVLGLALVALLAVGGLIATLLLRPAAPAASPQTATGAPPQLDVERWRVLASMPEPRADFALANSQSYLYVIGGEDPEGVSGDLLRYDVGADSWARYSAKPTPVADVQAAVIGGRIYVPGGRAADGSISDALEVYDPQSDSWASRAALPAPRSRYALAAVEGKLYLFGGWDGSAFADQVWQYSPDADSWAALTPMPAPRADVAAAVVGEQIALIGGENEGGPLARHDRYLPAAEGANPWLVRAPLPSPRSRLAASASTGWLFVVGGGGEPLSYNSSRDGWEPVELPAELEVSGARAQLSDTGQLLIVGGRGAAGLTADAFEYLAFFINTLPAVRTGD